jgi:pterin-4a-carbinolamine dehydratase
MTAAQWRQEDGALVRDLRFRDFDQAFTFVGKVAHGAIDYQRRPDMTISEFNHVRLLISNPHHSGITDAERRLAAKVDEVVEWSLPARPPSA